MIAVWYPQKIGSLVAVWCVQHTGSMLAAFWEHTGSTLAVPAGFEIHPLAVFACATGPTVPEGPQVDVAKAAAKNLCKLYKGGGLACSVDGTRKLSARGVAPPAHGRVGAPKRRQNSACRCFSAASSPGPTLPWWRPARQPWSSRSSMS